MALPHHGVFLRIGQQGEAFFYERCCTPDFALITQEKCSYVKRMSEPRSQLQFPGSLKSGLTQVECFRRSPLSAYDHRPHIAALQSPFGLIKAAILLLALLIELLCVVILSLLIEHIRPVMPPACLVEGIASCLSCAIHPFVERQTMIPESMKIEEWLERFPKTDQGFPILLFITVSRRTPE